MENKENIENKVPTMSAHAYRWAVEQNLIKKGDMPENIKSYAYSIGGLPIIYKNIGVAIFLSLITFGIYWIYWHYVLIKNVKTLRGDRSSCIGEVLCLSFVPFYPWYWWFIRGKQVKQCFEKQGLSCSGNEILYLVLSLLGLNLVNMAIMQSDFNDLAS